MGYIRSKAIRQAAKGENCTVNYPGCNYNPETTVFCHLDYLWAGKGKGLKSHDIGFFGCSDCHKIYGDKKMNDEYFYILRAVILTLKRLIEMEIVTVK